MATTRSFGIVTSVTGLSAGIAVNSLTKNDTAEIAEARDSSGKVTDLLAYSLGKTISVTGVLDSDAGTLVTAGASITIDTVTYIIDSVQKSETNNGFVNVTISAKTADSAVITPISTGT